MLKKIKKINKRLEEATKDFDLSKKYPNYFRKGIFRFFLILIFFIVIFDVWTHGVVSYSVECNTLSKCENPFYVCQEGEIDYIDSCENEMPAEVCKQVPCDKKYIEPGESYGRTDFLHKYGKSLIISLFIFAFIINHIAYLWRRYIGKTKML